MENEKALSEYIATLESSKFMVREIYKKLNAVTDKINPDDINYGHVGDIAEIEARLTEIYTDIK